MTRMIHRTQRSLVASLALSVLCAAALVSGPGTIAGASTPQGGTAPDEFDPKNFGNPASGKSTWLPLAPGYQTVKEGKVNRGHRRLSHRVVTTVTDVTKEINGVRAVAILDQEINGGEVGEQAVDFMAEDKAGNVWLLGSYTEAYEGGEFVNATDAWLAGVDGSEPGLLMPARPTKRTPEWVQEDTSQEGMSTAAVFETGVRDCVPFKCYKKVLVIKEGDELKYFARGVGGIRTKPESAGGENETEELINFTKLSPVGLKEMGDEVLRLDENASTASEDVFGPSEPAKRTL